MIWLTADQVAAEYIARLPVPLARKKVQLIVARGLAPTLSQDVSSVLIQQWRLRDHKVGERGVKDQTAKSGSDERAEEVKVEIFLRETYERSFS